MRLGSITVDGKLCGAIEVTISNTPPEPDNDGISNPAPSSLLQLASLETGIGQGNHPSDIGPDLENRSKPSVSHPASHPMGDRSDMPAPSHDESPSGKPLGGKTYGWWTPDRQRHAIDYLKDKGGLSELGAKALVARWAGVEAQSGPGEVNSIGATGIGQWLGKRKSGVVRGDFEGQLAHAVQELNGPESRAYETLKNARTEEEAAIGASEYERAEGYRSRTGRDNYVSKTIRYMHGLAGEDSTVAGVSRGGPVSPLQAAKGHNPNLSLVDPRLKEIIAAGATHLPDGYRVVVHEGYNPNGHVANSQHHIPGKGALDVAIVGPSGKEIPNRGADTTGLYTRLARGSYGEMLARHPELKGRFSWGGSFGTSRGSSTPDLMHFDIGGERGNASRYLTHMGALPEEKYGPKPEEKQAEAP